MTPNIIQHSSPFLTLPKNGSPKPLMALPTSTNPSLSIHSLMIPRCTQGREHTKLAAAQLSSARLPDLGKREHFYCIDKSMGFHLKEKLPNLHPNPPTLHCIYKLY